jgi:pyruvate dehydrogenase E1 component alpha subunit
MGGSPFSLFSEILGRASGCSGGKGGSMHISSMKNGFMGSMPIVAGTIPIAAGAALALKNSVIPSNQIAVVYFGDGAAEEGVFHETLNLASIYELPILFVCENNLMSSHLHISERQPSDDVRRFAVANNIQSVSVNGNDVFEMEATSSKLISYIRNTGKPAFLEAKTYRQYGHVGGYQDEIIGKNRQTDLQEWLQKDPLLWLKKLATEFQLDAVFEDIENSIELQMSSHWERALSEAWPESSSLTRNVYFED